MKDKHKIKCCFLRNLNFNLLFILASPWTYHMQERSRGNCWTVPEASWLQQGGLWRVLQRHHQKSLPLQSGSLNSAQSPRYQWFIWQNSYFYSKNWLWRWPASKLTAFFPKCSTDTNNMYISKLWFLPSFLVSCFVLAQSLFKILPLVYHLFC